MITIDSGFWLSVLNELTSPSLLTTDPIPVSTSPGATSQESAEWRARLQLGFASRKIPTDPSQSNKVDAAAAPCSYLKHRLHYGPLRVQRPLYPEGPQICHAVIVHPPGGVAGGDSLQIDIDVGARSHAVLATPGATKWYKSNQRSASQNITLRVHDGARLDWLPQNNIVFDSALAKLTFTAEIAVNASAIGWETTQLGRQTAGERWREGRLQASTTLKRPTGELLWTERALLDASDPIREAHQGLGGWNAFGTLWAIAATGRDSAADATAARLDPAVPPPAGAMPGAGTDALATTHNDAPSADAMSDLMDALNTLLASDHHTGDQDMCAGVTCLPNGVILIRAVARRMETLQTRFIQCWELLRPAIHGVPPRPLRLWTT